MRTKQQTEMWDHFDRLQQRVMADITTEEDFFNESEDAQVEFYDWMQRQCGEHACWM